MDSRHRVASSGEEDDTQSFGWQYSSGNLMLHSPHRRRGVITSAAIIMISVFLAFSMNPDPTVKAIGLGLAVAVFLDATVVRMVLVPATMALMGNGNWWLPKWLDRILPHIDIEGGEGLDDIQGPDSIEAPDVTPEPIAA
jgi:uncharacterized membrane protein YdfJ with MMPL/SSD domain